MGLFSNSKKLCPICGNPTPRLLATKIEGMPICKECDNKVDLPEGAVNQMSLEDFRQYVAFHGENQALRDCFAESYRFSFGLLSSSLLLDASHGLLRLKDDQEALVLEASSLKAFRISEDNRPLFEGGSESLRCYQSDVPAQVNAKKAREMQVLTHEEMQRFLIQAKEEGYFELFLLELATGLRRGEIMALQWADLDFETGELSITKQIYRARGELIISEPKTKASIRKLILPQGLLDVLREYRQGIHSRWMFPSPVKDDFPMDPAWIRKKMHIILEHAGCKGLRFHDLRHTFCTTALEHGMDVKTLSALLGHVSSATTLNIYTHITDNMRQDAAAKIDRGLGNTVADDADKRSDKTAEKPKQAFQPYKGDKRRAGTGCITQISQHCWEGRYSPMWPDGKKHSRNIYGKTREECESKLPDLIAEMKAEIAAIKAGGAEAMSAIPDGISKKKKSIVEYMHANPMVTNKALIARESGASRWTVQKYYDEIRRDVSRGATA